MGRSAGLKTRLIGTTQTLLGAAHIPLAPRVRLGERPILLDCGEDFSNGSDTSVRLKGYLNRQPSGRPSHGLVVFLHGWHGCAHASDVLVVAERLVRAGFDVFRLNFRDHGETGGLNVGFFNGTLLREVVTAIGHVNADLKPGRLFIVGHSLGGNFALRVGLQKQAQFKNLNRIVAVCPPLNPERVIQNIDSQFLFRTYFRNRWLRVLKRKQVDFPGRYDFATASLVRGNIELTEWLRQNYSNFSSSQDYFSRFSVQPKNFKNLWCPTTIVATRNDPVIPIADIEALPRHDLLKIQIFENGGHLGFTRAVPFYQRLLPDIVLQCLQDNTGSKLRNW